LKSFLFGGKFMGIVDVSDTADTIFQFGEFRLDVRTRELRTRGAPVHISPKAFELLLYLLEQRPRAVSKDELLDRIWPKTFISEATLTSVIAKSGKCSPTALVSRGSCEPFIALATHSVARSAIRRLHSSRFVRRSAFCSAKPASSC
jgi:hypothetical protein